MVRKKKNVESGIYVIKIDIYLLGKVYAFSYRF